MSSRSRSRSPVERNIEAQEACDDNEIVNNRGDTSFFHRRELFPCHDAIPEDVRKMCLRVACRLCNVNFNSKSHAASHYDGKSHSKKIRHFHLSANMEVEDMTHCKYCDLVLTSVVVALDHYAGKKHKTAVDKWEMGLTKRTLAKKALGQVNDENSDTIENMTFKLKEQPFACTLCNVSCDTSAIFETHLNGAKHKKKVASYEGLSIKSQIRNIANYRTPSGQYYCNICNNSMNSDVQYLQHLASKRHKKAQMLNSGNQVSDIPELINEMGGDQRENVTISSGE